MVLVKLIKSTFVNTAHQNYRIKQYSVLQYSLKQQKSFIDKELKSQILIQRLYYYNEIKNCVKERDSKMSQDLHSKLKNHMGYGTITRGQIPGDLEDYTVTLVKEYHKKSLPTLKLVFKLKKNDKYQSDFCVKIDNIIQPAHPMLLIKMSENQGKATAQATNKIKYKMALSVQKQHKLITQIIQKDEQQSDSDIPKGRPISSYFDLSQLESKPRKRKNNEQAEEQQSD